MLNDEFERDPKVPRLLDRKPAFISYKVSDNLEVFGLVRNLFDQHYYTYGNILRRHDGAHPTLRVPGTLRVPACRSPPIWACGEFPFFVSVDPSHVPID